MASISSGDDGDQDVTVGGQRGGTYRDAVTSCEIGIGDGGSISFHVVENSAGIYGLNRPGTIGVDGAFLR